MGRVLMGIGSSLTFVYCLYLARKNFEQDRFPVYVGLTNFMGMIGALAAQTPLEIWLQHASWQQIYLCLFNGTILLTPVLFFVAQPWKERPEIELETQSLKDDFLAIWEARKFFVFWIIVALSMVSPLLAIPEMWGDLYLETLYEYSYIESSLILSGFFIGVASGSLTLGYLSSKTPLRALILILLFGEIAFLGSFLAPFITSVPFMAFSAWGIGFCASGMLLFFSLLEKTFSYNPLAIPIFNMAIMIGSSAFQPLIGGLLDHLSPSMGLLYALQISLCLLPLFLGLTSFLWVDRT